jgi:hypothetical protein
MRYITPDRVISPKAHWLLRQILYDGGSPGAGTGWSAAVGQWKDDDHGWTEVLAVRWNGTRESPLGNPQSRGLPTWFVVPPELDAALRETIENLKSANGNDHDREVMTAASHETV